MIHTNILNSIAENYNIMTKSEKKIADFLMKEKKPLELVSISELAERCNVADSTIFRFCKVLGYNGYHEFKLEIAKLQGSEENARGSLDIYRSLAPSDNIQAIEEKLEVMYAAAIKQTMELLKPKNITLAAQILFEAEHVYCLGQGGSLITAMEAWNTFITTSSHFFCIQDTHLQVIGTSLLTEKDVIWFFSYSGSTKDMIDILAPAHKRGVKIIVVTRYASSPATQYADVVLICGSNESPTRSGTIIAKIAQLYVIDLIYQEYIRLAPEVCEKSRDITAAAIANRLV